MSASLKSNTGEVLGKAMVILVFDLVSTFVFLIFAALFALRYVVLWLLIIFSPLAFLAWAFPDIPKVKGLFEQWWQNFISWSIIGVPAAIVIYLSDKLIQIAKMGNLTGRSSSLEEVSPRHRRRYSHLRCSTHISHCGILNYSKRQCSGEFYGCRLG